MERRLDEELAVLRNKLLMMSSLVENAINSSIKALVERDENMARLVAESDAQVNQLEIEIDEMCLRLFARHQPTARDLRSIVMTLKINNDVERMGDLAVGIAERVLSLLKVPVLKPLIDIPRMAHSTQKMLRDALNAFVENDSELARDVCLSDDEVDQLNVQIFRELVVYMMEDPKSIQRAQDLIGISRNLERIADHATNIAEDVIYIVDGRVVKHHAVDL